MAAAKRLRSELTVTNEQVAFLEDEADEARLRALRELCEELGMSTLR